MLATSLTAAVLGVEAHLVRVEADSAPGFPRFTMVGLPDSAVKESEARIRAALRNCGIPFKWDRRITVNLAPASLRKYGLVLRPRHRHRAPRRRRGLLVPRLADVLLVGELALDGALRPVAGVLPMLLLARRHGLRAAIVPDANHREAALAPGLPVHPVASLPEALALLARDELPPAPPAPGPAATRPHRKRDLADVRGQALARRALEIAAAGGHNLLLVGPPGLGQDDAGPAAARHPAPAPAGRGGRDRRHPLSRRPPGRRGRGPSALPQPAPHGERCGPRRRRPAPPPRRGQPRPQRRPLPGRAAGVPAGSARGAPPAARGGPRHRRPPPGRLPHARPFPARRPR